MDEFDDIPDDVAAILARQDEALALLARLRAAEPHVRPRLDTVGEKRREFRRWPTPDGVTLEFHDGEKWRKVQCADMGIGGARLHWPEGVLAPVPARLKTPATAAVLALVDVMWRDSKTNLTGVRFEFQDEEERDSWSGGLVDALLARHAVS
jgi:hypothetical protein